jgi:cytochrome c peroxidase
LQAYIRLLVSRNAPFDQFMAGDACALSEAAQRGASLFAGKARCTSCHNGPHFSDGLFHNLGVPQIGDKVPASDDGRYKDVPALLTSPFSTATSASDDTTTGRLAGLTNPMPESARGAFRTASLRGVALTAPYMHSGQISTLEDVVEFYDVGGLTPVAGTKDPLMVRLFLSDSEKADLVEFLKALTGEPIAPALLVDTSTP